MAAGRLALLCLGLTVLTTEVMSQTPPQPRRCSYPEWQSSLGFENPLLAHRGKVVLVALMKGYCGYCVQQAESLEALQGHLARQGLPDIEIILVNGGENISRINIHNLQNAANFPVLQDTEDHVLFHQVFAGSKDDFVIYNRCGQRLFLIPHPYSYMGHTITERVLRAVYTGYNPCRCRQERPRDPRDRMQGDQPMGGPSYDVISSGSGQDVNMINCPRGDTWCERYVTELRQGTLGSRMHLNRPQLRQHLEDPQGSTARRGGGRRGRGRRRGGRRRGGRRGHRFRSRRPNLFQNIRSRPGSQNRHRLRGFGAAT